jgi:hypothetical protein
MDFGWVWDRLEDYREFPTVREIERQLQALTAAYPDRVRLEDVGRSRAGAPLWALEIGRGAQRALWIACPHPNEPIGALTVLALARLLLTQPRLSPLDYTWTLLPCVDPDGARLNEGWFNRPGDVRAYARGFYRPEMSAQVEWTFPCRCEEVLFDAPLPETAALMKLIDELKPAFMYSLHNAGFGGVYFYLSRAAPGLCRNLADAVRPAGLAMHLGEPEVPYALGLAPSVYQMPTIRQAYDFFRTYGVDPRLGIPAGASSSEYAAERAGTLSLVTEVPYFDDRRVDCVDATRVTRRESLRLSLDAMREFHSSLRAALDAVDDALQWTPFLAAVSDLASHLPCRLDSLGRWVDADPSLERPATVAELFHSRTVVWFYHALNLGMLVRALEHPIAAAAADQVADVRARVVAKREAYCDRVLAESPCRSLPIRTLVAAQLICGIATANHLQA